MEAKLKHDGNSRKKLYLLIMIIVCGWSIDCLSLCIALFAPQDNLPEKLLTFIDQEEKTILCAMYMFTDKKIAQALIHAKKRGVDVQVVLDQLSMMSYGKGKFLQEQGVPVFVHTAGDSNPYTMSLMHHKFFIFGLQKNTGSSLVWTGSWNCTVKGSSVNNENVMITDDPSIFILYVDQFYLLKNKLCL